MNRRSIIALVAVVIVATGLGWFFAHRGQGSENADHTASTAPNVATATTREGTFAVRVVAQGRIGPPAGSSAKIAFAEPGIVQSIAVRVGQSVGAGETLAQLDRSALSAALQQARADAAAAAGQYGGGSVPATAVRSAQAKLALAATQLQTLERGGPAALSTQISAQQTLRQAQLKVEADQATVARDQTLLRGGVIAAKELQIAQNQAASDEADRRAAQAKAAASDAGFSASLKQARAEYAAAQNDLEAAQAQTSVLGAQSGSAQARLTAAQVAYDQGRLRAPSAGIVLAILKHPGEAVDPTTPVIEVGPGSADAVTLSVPADRAQRVHVGDAVELEIPRSGERSSGRVTAVVPAVDPATQSATVSVSGGPSDAVPGDAVSATILVDRLRGVLVPAAAIVEDPQTGKTVVFVSGKNASFASHEVTVRASDANTAVVGGVSAGLTVATQGSYELLAPPGG